MTNIPMELEEAWQGLSESEIETEKAKILEMNVGDMYEKNDAVITVSHRILGELQ